MAVLYPLKLAKLRVEGAPLQRTKLESKPRTKFTDGHLGAAILEFIPSIHRKKTSINYNRHQFKTDNMLCLQMVSEEDIVTLVMECHHLAPLELWLVVIQGGKHSSDSVPKACGHVVDDHLWTAVIETSSILYFSQLHKIIILIRFLNSIKLLKETTLLTLISLLYRIPLRR